jgi:hypothetical protein
VDNWGYFRESEKTYFHICDKASANDFYHPEYQGIDTYAVTCIHESTHMTNFNKWWPNGYDPIAECSDAGRDYDCDKVPTEFEVDNNLNPVDWNTHRCEGCPWDSDWEYLAFKAEEAWVPCAADSQDWAYPGHQWDSVPAYCP